MSYLAVFTYKQPMSQKAHDYRDEMVKTFKDVKGVWIDVFAFEPLMEELEKTSRGAQDKLVALSKKAGLKPKGRPDLSYGIHGDKEGPLEMWFSIQAES